MFNFKGLLRDAAINVILVEHRDRLIRFGCEYLETAMSSQGRRLMVIEETEVKDDPVRNLIKVLTSFCARLYSRRAALNKDKKDMEPIRDENS